MAIIALDRAADDLVTRRRYHVAMLIGVLIFLGLMSLRPGGRGASAHERLRKMGLNVSIEELPGNSANQRSEQAPVDPVVDNMLTEPPTKPAAVDKGNYTIPSNEELVKRHRVEIDPAFVCNYHNWRWIQTSFMTGYLTGRNNRLTGQLGNFRPTIRLTDYGCFTGYTIHGNGVLWAVIHEENQHNQHRITLGVDPVTGEVFDVASSKFTYTWYCAGEFNDDRQGFALPNIANRLMKQHAPTARAWLEGNFDYVPPQIPDESLGQDQFWTGPTNLGNLTYIPGAAFIAPMQFGRYVGQAFQQYMTYIARFWATGAMLDGRATLVIARPYDVKWRPLFEWFFPFAPGGGMFVELDKAVFAKTAHFATPAGWEPPDPCTMFFVQRFLLPKARQLLRKDPTFQYGDEKVRKDKSKSDIDWANTLPKKVAIIKNGSNSRAGDRAFDFDEPSRRIILDEGFVLVSDTAPILHRLLLVNHVEVLGITYGALMVMMMFLWGRLDQPPSQRMRIIALVNHEYQEEGFYSPHWKREGVQDGMRINIHKDSIFPLPGVWIKFVIWPERHIPMSKHFRPSHMRFSKDDCRAYPLTAEQIAKGAVVDFESTFVAENPNADGRWFHSTDLLSHVPKVGHCFSRERLGNEMKMNLSTIDGGV